MDPVEREVLPTILELDWQQFYAMQHISDGLLGLHNEQFKVGWDFMREELWARFSAAVLAEDAGEKVEDYVTWLSPLRPWWIPKWLWRKIPTKPVRYTLTVQPRYIYPHATLKVPQVGAPVRFAYQTLDWRMSTDWRTGDERADRPE